MKNPNTPKGSDEVLTVPGKKPAIGKIQKETHDDAENIDVV